MHGMALGFDEIAGARKHGDSTSRDVQISHRRRIERRISLDFRAPKYLSDIGRERTQYKEEDGCHYLLAVHNARLHN
jgi:hypothetical protein